MKRFVIDGSILIKLFFEEEHSRTCIRHVKNATEILAPDLLWVEAANVVWKRLQRKEITAEDAVAIVGDMVRVPVFTHPAFELVNAAMPLSVATSRTVYDCLYLALAIREDIPLLTADERFANALKTSPFAKKVYFIGAR